MEPMFWISRLFCGVSFVLYNFIGFQYVEIVLSSVCLSKLKKIVIAFFNTLLYLVLSSFGLQIYIVYMLGFVTLVFEFMYIYKLTFRRIIYVASTFMFNIAAIRNLVLSVVALVTFQRINQVSGSDYLYNFVMTLSFLILDIVMLLFIKEKFVTFEDLALFAKAKMQETYAAVLSSLIFGYIMLFTGTHTYNVNSLDLTLLNLLTPIILSALYYVSFAYAIKMCKMFVVERHSRALESELKETLESKLRLEHIAYIDPLTNAYSRRFCIEKIALLLQDKTEFSLCFIDVDKLKFVNDSYGHSEGDVYLQLIANVLCSVLRRDDFISRMGGDEFVIILPNCTKPTAEKRLKSAHQQVIHLKKEKELLYDTCISYGIVEVNQNNTLCVEQLLAQADQLMYTFKEAQKKLATLG